MRVVAVAFLGLAFAVGCGGRGGGDRVDPSVKPTPPPPDGTAAVTISTAAEHQTLVGFGAAIAYYAGYLTGRNIPDDDIYQVLFADLGLDVLRIGNWYQNQRSTGTTTDTAFGDTAIAGVIQDATTALGQSSAASTSWAASAQASIESRPVGRGSESPKPTVSMAMAR